MRNYLTVFDFYLFKNVNISKCKLYEKFASFNSYIIEQKRKKHVFIVKKSSYSRTTL